MSATIELEHSVLESGEEYQQKDVEQIASYGRTVFEALASEAVRTESDGPLTRYPDGQTVPDATDL